MRGEKVQQETGMTLHESASALLKGYTHTFGELSEDIVDDGLEVVNCRVEQVAVHFVFQLRLVGFLWAKTKSYTKYKNKITHRLTSNTCTKYLVTKASFYEKCFD